MMTSVNGSAQNGESLRTNCPQYVDYEQFFNKSAKRREQPALRKDVGFQMRDDYIRMGGGFPNPAVFPVVEADFKLRDGTVLHVDPKQMITGLQYHLSEGLAEVREWMTAFQDRLHSPPTLREPKHPGRFDLILTNGGNEGISQAFALLLEEGDWALCEEATYATAMSMMPPIGSAFYGIKADEHGMIPEDLEGVLSSWGEIKPGARKPRIIYTITSGGNPTGVTWSLDRKRAVYKIARAHDLLIIEDDAYYFLQFNRPLIPTFLSLDVDGRVIHVETFSKLVAPGLRVACTSGPEEIMRKMRLQRDTGPLFSSGVSQMMLLQLLKHWGQDGFLKHVDGLMEFYREQANRAVHYASKHLAGLADWSPPSGGFFLWLRVLRVEDSEQIVNKCLERRLVSIAGRHFLPSKQKSPYIRLSFADVTDEMFDEAFRILAEVIREETANNAQNGQQK